MNWLLSNSLSRSRFALKVRNKFGIKPSSFYVPYIQWYLSASDLFLWRSDYNWKTVFRASDTAIKYFGIQSTLKIIVCDHQNIILDSKYIEFKDGIAEVFIDDFEFQQNKSGHFYAFTVLDEASHANPDNIKIINRCYTGYSFMGNCWLFVNGNLICVYSDENELQHPAFLSNIGKFSYTIQRPFDEGLCNYELFLVNPTDRDQLFELDCNSIKLRSLESTIIPLINNTTVMTVRSSFELPRAIIIKIANNFVDVHHA